MSRPPSEPHPELGWTALSSLVLAIAASLVAGAASLPPGAPARVYVALAGGATSSAVPLAVGLRALRHSAARTVSVVMFGGWLAIGPLALLGALMKSHTHHHPLAAATYAVLALAVVLGALAVGARLGALAHSVELTAGTRRAARTAFAVVGLLAGALNLLVLRRSASEPVFMRALLDGVLLAGAAVIAARISPRIRPSATIALLLWAAVVMAGAQALSDPATAATATERAPLLLGPLWILV